MSWLVGARVPGWRTPAAARAGALRRRCEPSWLRHGHSARRARTPRLSTRHERAASRASTRCSPPTCRAWSASCAAPDRTGCALRRSPAGERPRLFVGDRRAGRGVESFRGRGRVRACRGAYDPLPVLADTDTAVAPAPAIFDEVGQRHVRRPQPTASWMSSLERAAGPLALLPAPPVQRSPRAGPAWSTTPPTRHLTTAAHQNPHGSACSSPAARHPQHRFHVRTDDVGGSFRAEGLRQPRGRRGVRGGCRPAGR
jgi:hypothetical protein